MTRSDRVSKAAIFSIASPIPTYIVADAVVRAVAGTVLAGGGRAVDICGGSGHLTRSLVGLSSPPPVLADLYFAKVWLARRFTAPECEPVCCDGNSPMPFARGAFKFAMCTDAFMYIWTKRQFVGEMARLIDGEGEPGAVLIGHTHNERTWTPSHGQPLTPEGYRDLFETLEPRIFGEAGLFDDVVQGGPLDLSRRDSNDAIDRDQALTIVATRHTGVFTGPSAAGVAGGAGELRLNPLYEVERDAAQVRLRLRFPSEDYEQEYGACRQYLPETMVFDAAALASLESGQLSAELRELVHRRVLVGSAQELLLARLRLRPAVKLRLKPTSKSRASVFGEPSLGGRFAAAAKTASKAHRQELASMSSFRP